jgi:hypothetical protein
MTDLFEFESEEDLVPIVYNGPFEEQGEILFSYDVPDESKEATAKANEWTGDLGFDMNTEQAQNFESSYPIADFASNYNSNAMNVTSAADDSSMMFASNNNSPFNINSTTNNSMSATNNNNFRPNANSGMSNFEEMPISFSSNAVSTTYSKPSGLFVNTNMPLAFNSANFNTSPSPTHFNGTAPSFNNGSASPNNFNRVAPSFITVGNASPTSFNRALPSFINVGNASPNSFNRAPPNFNTGQASPPTSFNSAAPNFGFRSNSSGNISFSSPNNFHFPQSNFPSSSDVSSANMSMMQGRVSNDFNQNYMNLAPHSINNSNSMSLFSNDDEMSPSTTGYQTYPLNYSMPASLSAPPARRVRSASSPPNIYTVSNFSSVALAQGHSHFMDAKSKSDAKLSLSSDSSGPSYSSSASADEFSDEFSFGDEVSEENELQILEITSKFTLPSSKSPIIEAMAFCAVHHWGISIVHSSDSPEVGARVIFLVKNFSQYCRFSRLICSKRHPTHNEGARIKALRRWFIKFPKKKERKSRESFILEVKPACHRLLFC